MLPNEFVGKPVTSELEVANFLSVHMRISEAVPI